MNAENIKDLSKIRYERSLELLKGSEKLLVSTCFLHNERKEGRYWLLII